MGVSLFIGSAFGVFGLLNLAYKRTRHYIGQFHQVRKFESVPGDLEIINLGSNYAMYGFNYEGLGLKAFNFALSPQYLLYDLNILKAYASHLKEDCIVLVAFPPCAFCFDGVGCCDDKYYRFLPRTLIPKYSWLKNIASLGLPLLAHPTHVRFLINDTKVMCHSEQDETDCEKAALARRDGWIRQFNLRDTVSDQFPPEVIKQFEATTSIVSETIEYCLDRRLRPVLVLPPVSTALRQLLGSPFLKGALYDNLHRANARRVPVLDYLNDEQLADYSLYRNSDFLNKHGAKLFTGNAIRDLQSIDYLPKKT